MIRLIIFDLDGTLADTLDDIGDGVNRMLSDFSFPLLTRKDIQANINNGPRELIRRCLPEKYRAVFVLHYLEQMSVTDVAKSLGLSQSAVKMRLSRGRELLKEKLDLIS